MPHFGLRLIAFIACLAAWHGAGMAAATAAEPSPATVYASARTTNHDSSGEVVIFNRPVVRFAAPILGMSAEERARRASERLRLLLTPAGTHTVTTETIAQGVVVKVDGQVAFGISNDDVDNMGADALTTTAADAVRALETVIAEMKEARDPRALLTAAAWASAATAIWLAAVWLLIRVRRGMEGRVLRFVEARTHAMRNAGAEIIQPRAAALVRGCLTVAFWLLVLLLTHEWLGYVLSRFPYTRPWGEALAAFLVDTIAGILSAIVASIPGLLIAILIFLLAHFANSLLRSFFDAVQEKRLTFSWIDADSAQPTRRLVIIAVWLFAVAMAYPYLPGAQSDAFRGLSVLLGLMVSVGASGIVGQAAAGLILMYTRAFRAGEFVRIGDNEGTVVALGMFTTRILTGMGEELTLPNSVVLATVTRNYSRVVSDRGFIVDAGVTIGYDTPWRQVHAMLIEAARRTPGVLTTPPPRVYQTALSDFYVEYRVICQATPEGPQPRAEVISTVHANIQDVFNENGVQIMSPHYLGDPKDAKLVPPAGWYPPPAAPPG